MIQLSSRLKTVAEYIPNGSFLADIGSDHAYLPIFAFQNNIIRGAIAGDVADGPIAAAQASVNEADLTDVIETRKGNGLAVISDEDQVDCVTICGMGGSLIASILDNDKDKLATVKRLILQPNISANVIRRWLIQHNWELLAEKILEEDGHIYEILVAEKGDSYKPYNQDKIDQEILFGPFLLKEKSPAFLEKWSREYKEWNRIYEQLNKAVENEQIHKKKKQLKDYIEWYEEEIGHETSERS
ncbi:tRNA (adenine(22)-N(1))-methyltransferase [Pallidibacillus pasinlerensis]|uniref:tRNA (Adenine(22)-N(1))-methyltransferase TrmK n=1 Tax=Pallidibacillus pasinlerensis TaxID=2703818 RepID=A0ABX0A894_9BACI|nr:tRNA (adenine(22)-N(1))-methyltransferase TrmK [Pallidibacillus pasinlerensis]NCU18729.1 tRNA (adenine(22)-N(1))-methyltransferase TrmK [Pallidibacillus pasinlerensis]